MLCQYRIPDREASRPWSNPENWSPPFHGPYQGEVFDWLDLSLTHGQWAETLRVEGGFSWTSYIRAALSHIRPVASYSPLAALLAPYPRVLWVPDVSEAERAESILLLSALKLGWEGVWRETFLRNVLPSPTEPTPLNQELRELCRYHSWGMLPK